MTLFLSCIVSLLASVTFWVTSSVATDDMLQWMFPASPGTKQCTSASGTFCLDMTIDSFNERIYMYTNGVRDYANVQGCVVPSCTNEVGVYKNATEGTVNWRCFSDPGKLCNAPKANFPPHGTPRYMVLPSIACSSIVDGKRTPGAASVPGYFSQWKQFQQRGLNPNNCGDLGLQGSNWQKMWAFMATSCNMGGSIGTTNLVVYESESIHVQPSSHVGGERLERYFGLWGKGRVKEGGFDDPTCRANPTNPASCNGNYTQAAPGNTSFPWTVSGDMTANSVCPY